MIHAAWDIMCMYVYVCVCRVEHAMKLCNKLFTIRHCAPLFHKIFSESMIKMSIKIHFSISIGTTQWVWKYGGVHNTPDRSEGKHVSSGYQHGETAIGRQALHRVEETKRRKTLEK